MQREAGGPSQREEDLGVEDAVSLMHRGTRSPAREESGRRRRRSRRWDGEGGRDRSRGARAGDRTNANSRAERVRERVTRESRQLVPAVCRPDRDEWQEWRPSRGEPASASTAPRREPGLGSNELDLVQATGEWFLLLGLRQPGEEQVEPSNAITRQRQAQTRTTLTAMSDKDLTMMYMALLRLMGMLYIESARLISQVMTTRQRNNDMVEVEVAVDRDEDDDESIYMQRSLQLHSPETWEKTLQELLSWAERGTEATVGVVHALRRRITSSLYLQTARGSQLQAVLVAAAAGGNRHDETLVCDTEQNDEALVEQWWGRLRQYMDLGLGESGEARASDEADAIGPSQCPLANPEHDPKEVEQWEAARLALQEEERQKTEEEEALQEWRAREESQQEAADAAPLCGT